MAVTLYKTFHRRLKCIANDFRQATFQKRDLMSTGNIDVDLVGYHRSTGTVESVYVAAEIRLDNLCSHFIDDYKFFMNITTIIPCCPVPQKRAAVRVFINCSDGTLERVELIGVIHVISSIVIQFEIHDISRKYVTENEEVIFTFELDIYVYHYVHDTTLQDLCYANLSLSLTKKNVFEVLTYAEAYVMKDLVDQCVNMIVLHYEEFQHSEHYKKLKDWLKEKVEYEKFVNALYNPEFQEELITNDTDSEEEYEQH